ncbi:MAG TPA: type II toxin-antitoxin system HipA family toxin, partial [Candidatus Xenobia bacterium]
MSEVLVFDNDRPIGTLWFRTRAGHESTTFEYHRAWLEDRASYSIDPALPASAGSFHTQALSGAMADSAPDRWGRTLMRRAEQQTARREGRAPRTLQEIDYLLQVDDRARQGALRYRLGQDQPFLAARDPPIPPLVHLPRLLKASQRVMTDQDTEADLRLLLAPGSSLGGARPKASVIDGDHLAIAKFPAPADEWSVVRWEAVALALAADCGIDVPAWRLLEAAGRPVLVTRRFDRDNGRRLPYLSALSMLQARERETRSYLEIVDALHRFGSRPTADMQQLWLRVIFSVLISNTDDHLRNHGFLHEAAGWRLSPAFDMNPVPVEVKPRILSTAISEADATA